MHAGRRRCALSFALLISCAPSVSVTPGGAGGASSGLGATAGTAATTSGPSTTSSTAAGTPSCDPNITATDPTNCGSCGHDCQGGACLSGTCQPVLLTYEAGQPGAIALDAAHIYWLNITWLARIDKNGAGTTPVHLTTTVAHPRALSVLSDRIYYGQLAEHPTIKSLPLLGGAESAIADDWIGGGDFAVNGAEIYWTVFDSWLAMGRIMKSTTGGGPSTVLAPDRWNPASLSVDAGYLYWTEYTDVNVMPPAPTLGGVVRASLATGAVETLYAGHDISVIALDDLYVYFLNTGESGATNGSVLRVLKSGGAAETLASGIGGLSGIALDTSQVYFTSKTAQEVRAVPKSGGPTKLLASTPDGSPGALAVDDLSVYWVDTKGAIMKVAK